MIEPTREKDTEVAYFNRAISLMKKALYEAQNEDHEYAKNIISLKHKGQRVLCLDIKYTSVWAATKWSSTLMHSSWKLYRASLIYMAELYLKKNKINQKQFDKIKELLGKTSGCSKGDVEKRTSAKKKKSFNLKEFKTLDKALIKSKNKWSSMLRIWLRAGIISGLRPIEWKNCRYHEETKELVTKNAKNTNGRALGEFRSVSLSHIDDDKIKDIINHIKIAQTFESNNKWEEYYTGCSNLLKYTLRKIFPNKDTYPTLYSCRHQFSANMKASGCSKKEVAALMGHASDKTAQAHYGKKIHGRRGKKPNVNPLDIRRVKTTEKPNFKFDNKK